MTYSEILKETQFLLGFENDVNFVNYSKEAMTRHSNRALDELTSIILKTDGSWQWDDKNHPDLPIAVTDVVMDQGQYTMTTKHLLVSRLEIKDADGKSRVLKTIEEENIDTPIEDMMLESGTPTHYQKVGESLFLFPKPDYDLVDGMRIYFSRPASYFEETDTTKEAGFAEIFHEFIPLWNARHFSSSQQDMTATFNKMDMLLKDIKERIKLHYRSRARKVRLTVSVPNSL